MTADEERLDRIARILEEGEREGSTASALDLEAHREALGADFPELEAIVEAERILEAYMEPSDGAALPRDLGAWRLEQELGRGGMGIVYGAVHRTTGQRAAVKVLRPGLVSHLDARVRFRREAEALMRVHHPHVVRLLDVGVQGEEPFYAMDLIEGESLDRALPPGQAVDWTGIAAGLADVADALHALHEAGLVHRDLKPSNVVVARDGTWMLADFGLATAEDFLTLTRTGDALGTPAYMAPEQVLGRHDAVDAQSDVYGLGATLYHLLAGRSPVQADEAHTLEMAILRRRPRSPRAFVPGAPRALARVALKALEKRPADRYASAAALRDDLRAFAAGRSVQGRPVPAVRRGLRTLRRRPLLSLGAAAALVVAAFLLLRTTPASLTLDAAPPADLLVDGRPVGRTPIEGLRLDPGARRLTLRPVDVRFREREDVLLVEEGAAYRLQWVLEPVDAGDWESVEVLARAIGVRFDRPTRPAARRAGRTPDVQLLWPRGRVRPRDLAAASLRIDVTERQGFPARLVFVRGGRPTVEIAAWTPDKVVNRVDLPPSVLEGLAAGDVVTWRLEREGRDTLDAAFEIAPDDLADPEVARIDAGLGGAPAEEPLRSILAARALLNAGLPFAAWHVVRARVEAGEENLLLLALEKEALEALLPREGDRLASRPWRELLGRLLDPDRYSDAQRDAVFGPEVR